MASAAERRAGARREAPPTHQWTPLQCAWAEFLRTIEWRAWATGTVERPREAWSLEQITRRWLHTLGNPHSYALGGGQRGNALQHVHVHVLIGGISRLEITRLRASWIKHGHLRIEPFRPNGGAIPYLVNQADELVLFGSGQFHRHRPSAAEKLRQRTGLPHQPIQEVP